MRTSDGVHVGSRKGWRSLIRFGIAGLVAAGLAGARPAWPQAPTTAAAAGGADSQYASSHVPRRAFEHRYHDRLDCTRCHGSGAEHRTFFVRTATDCARCHHDAQLGKACTDCHARESLPVDTRVDVPVQITARDTTVARTLPFGHDRHQRLECRECHDTPVTLDRSRQCRSCHDRHHGSEATCTSCHSATTGDTLRARHTARAHLGCAGTGCHAAAVAPSPALSRNLCVLCHPEQRTHEPNGTCAVCHRIPRATFAGTTAAARGQPETHR